ncbi:hypothetical protein GQ53DRAFT_790348 [Thozetella sp. PMI_491]|nr:hypothetical protein GQ53DRAFT_790348 [Thozetella sp. PMI_491]
MQQRKSRIAPTLLLIGDVSRGACEFCASNAELGKCMIEHYGSDIVAFETDWLMLRPSIATFGGVPGSVRPRRSSPSRLHPRRPDGNLHALSTLIWRSLKVQKFVDPHDAVGLYGLCQYSAPGLVAATVAYPNCANPDMTSMARDQYSLKKRLECASAAWNGDEFRGVGQNAQLVRDAHCRLTALPEAKHYYSAIYYGCGEYWNLRDNHMRRVGSQQHVGDARTTTIKSWSDDELNRGQLCKGVCRRPALIIDCFSHGGSAPLLWKRPERFIGIIYGPDAEKESRYSSAGLPEQVDGLLWFDEAQHLGARKVHQPHAANLFGET